MFLNKPVHPIWLSLRDRDLMTKFTTQKRLNLIRLVAWVAIFHWVLAFFIVLSSINALSEEG